MRSGRLFRRERIEFEELEYGDAKLRRKHFEIFERWSVDAAFNKTQEVHRYSEQLSELFLAQSPRRSNFFEPVPELFAKTRQLSPSGWAESRLSVFSSPPNEITGCPAIRAVLSFSATTRLPSLTTRKEYTEEVRVHDQKQMVEAKVSDERLIRLVLDGSKEALAQLFQRYAKTVRGLAYQVLRDPSEADDLLQDLFILIQRKCALFDPSRGPARFWILQMAYHCALGRRRYLNSRHFYTRVDLADVENELSDRGNGIHGRVHGDNELLENSPLKLGFEGLSEDQRQTLRLFFVEGYTLPEIAAKLNQSHGNVKHHYFRGLEKLRKHVFNGKLRGNSAV